MHPEPTLRGLAQRGLARVRPGKDRARIINHPRPPGEGRHMDNCIFCKIIKGEIPSYKIYEDENSIGVLDVFPNTEGQSLVISKKHFPSDFTKMPGKEFQKFLLSAKKICELLKEKLGVQTVGLVIEGTGINHAHIKLYPMHGLTEEFEQIIAPERVYYDKYPGFVDTRLGPKAEDKDLEKIVAKIFDKD